MRRKLKVILTVMVVFILAASSICSVFAAPRERNDNQRGQLYNQNVNINFSDVGMDFWGYKAINDLAKRGIINGYSDKTFKPNAKVTRAEFATMLTKALNLTPTDNTQTFADVLPSNWAFNAVEASKNYLTGYRTGNGTMYFYGSNDAVREDMAVALVKALNLTVQSDNGQLQQIFKDYNTISTSLRDYVFTAYENGIMLGSDGKFAAQKTLTRAEAASLLQRALQKTNKIPVDDSDSSDSQKVPVDNPGQGSLADTDATLFNLTYNGILVSGFNANTLNYNVVLPAGTTAIPVVSAAVNDTGKATAIITQAAGLPGYAMVRVTAQDGVTQKTYYINFTASTTGLNTDATLFNMTYNGILVPSFNANTFNYNVVLPAGTTAIPVVSAAVNATGKATLVVKQAAGLPGYAMVRVTAQDRVTQKTYYVNFTVAAAAKNTDATLFNLTYNGTLVSGFNANTLAYNVVLPAGTTAIPVVSAAVNDTGKATAVVTQAPGLPGYAMVRVTAQDGITQRTYTIYFTVAAAAKDTDANLFNLTYNGILVSGFNANTINYNVVLPAGSTVIPVVSAAVNDTGKATAVVTQATGLPGNATVTVTAQDGVTQKTYTIYFTISAT
jgi:hypothetical protein